MSIIKKGDIILAITLISLSIILLFFVAPKDGEVTATIMHDGEVVYSGNLEGTRTFNINGDVNNTIVIDNGTIRYERSTCKGQDCVHSGALSKAGQMAACLPNKTAIILSQENSEVDAIAK